MNFVRKASRQFFGVLLLFAFCGCSERMTVEVADEQDEPLYRRAKDLMDRGKRNEALENYLKLILKRNDDAPESHLEAGRIYLYHIKDPISAIYHLKRYRFLQEPNRDAPEVRQKIELVDELIKTAMKDFATSFDAEIFQNPLERLSLLDTIDRLQNENEALKEELLRARQALQAQGAGSYQRGGASPAAGEPEPGRPSQPTSTPRATVAPRGTVGTGAESEGSWQTQPRRYVIQSGDTLYSISREVYGDGNRWTDILQANRDALPDPGRLKVGTTLVIPE